MCKLSLRMGCISSKAFAVHLWVFNTLMIILMYSTISIFECNCTKCLSDQQIINLLLMGPIILFILVYYIGYISYRKQVKGAYKGGTSIFRVSGALFFGILSLAIAILNAVVLTYGFFIHHTLEGRYSTALLAVNYSFVGYAVVVLFVGCAVLPRDRRNRRNVAVRAHSSRGGGIVGNGFRESLRGSNGAGAGAAEEDEDDEEQSVII